MVSRDSAAIASAAQHIEETPAQELRLDFTADVRSVGGASHKWHQATVRRLGPVDLLVHKFRRGRRLDHRYLLMTRSGKARSNCSC